jgi:plasmid stability protein
MNSSCEAAMSTLTIRNLDSSIKEKLRTSAARHGRSMEAEVRDILREALMTAKPDRGLGSRIRARFAAEGGVELDLPARADAGRPARFDEGSAR